MEFYDVTFSYIEVKYIDEDLEKYIEQLKSHREFYKKVIYTNGLIWKYYAPLNEDALWETTLGNIEKDEITWNKEEKWTELLDHLEGIIWTKKVVLSHE